MSLDTEPPCKKAKSQVSVDVGSSESKLVMEASVDIEEVCNSSVYTLLLVPLNIFQDNCCHFELHYSFVILSQGHEDSSVQF